MEFRLNEYHRNVSDEELISDVVDVAKALNKKSLTADEYNINGKYSSSTCIRRFSSWKKVLELSGLDVRGHNFRIECSVDEIVEDVKRVASIYGKKAITAKEYDMYGKYNSATLAKRYRGWNNILKLAKMDVVLNRNYTNIEMFEEIEHIWILLGRQPTSNDIKNGISKFSLNSYCRKFGGWRGALQAFVDYINDDSNDDGFERSHNNAQNFNIDDEKAPKHTTKRDVNYRLRFKVMQRDNFKCCMCGASPAKDSNVELHIDHIVPWSKGGETTIDNLQTLCSKCNLGKSDLPM